MSNTLLNYFKKNTDATKSPTPVAKKESILKLNSPKVDKENSKPESKNVAEVMELDDDDDEIVRPSTRATQNSESKPKRSIETKEETRNVKRRRLMVLDSDSDTEARNTKSKKKPADSSPDIELKSEESMDEDLEEDDDEEEDVKPKSKKKPALKNKNLSVASVNSPKTPKGRTTVTKAPIDTPSSASKSSLSSFSANFDTESTQPIEGKFKHLFYEFLQDDKIK